MSFFPWNIGTNVYIYNIIYYYYYIIYMFHAGFETGTKCNSVEHMEQIR